jgi:hypothetical protein
MLMKKITFIFSLLIFCGNIFAQENRLVVYGKDGEKKSDTIHVGDYLKVSLINGKRIAGNVALIASDYFVVGYDTIQSEQVTHIDYEPQNYNDVGKILLVIGGALIIGGATFIIVALHTNNSDGLGLFAKGVLLSGGGIIFFIVGTILNVSEKMVRRRIGYYWFVKIA